MSQEGSRDVHSLNIGCWKVPSAAHNRIRGLRGIRTARGCNEAVKVKKNTSGVAWWLFRKAWDDTRVWGGLRTFLSAWGGLRTCLGAAYASTATSSHIPVARAIISGCSDSSTSWGVRKGFIVPVGAIIGGDKVLGIIAELRPQCRRE